MEEEQNNGLFKGHAYSITGVMEVISFYISIIVIRCIWPR